MFLSKIHYFRNLLLFSFFLSLPFCTLYTFIFCLPKKGAITPNSKILYLLTFKRLFFFLFLKGKERKKNLSYRLITSIQIKHFSPTLFSSFCGSTVLNDNPCYYSSWGYITQFLAAKRHSSFHVSKTPFTSNIQTNKKKNNKEQFKIVKQERENKQINDSWPLLTTSILKFIYKYI